MSRIESPLHYFQNLSVSDHSVGVRFREMPVCTHLVLRGNQDDPLFLQAVSNACNISIPTDPCTSNTQNDATIYWSGPNEWLLLASFDRQSSLVSKLQSTLPDTSAVINVSGGQTLVNLGGTAVEYLMKLASVYDFHPNNFPAGKCVQTTFAKATALVCKKPDGTFDLVIRRSFSDYIAQWVQDAASNVGISLEINAL